ncbi:MAG: hypothetical protein U0575_15220 [Phycisphaerales bacterium]
MVRSILAIVVGFVVWSVVWLAAGLATHAIFPSAYAESGAVAALAPLATLLLASVICSIAAGAATAAITRPRSITPAWMLACILLGVGIMVEASIWTLIPSWYHIVFLVLLVPATIAGASMVAGAKAGAAPT